MRGGQSHSAGVSGFHRDGRIPPLLRIWYLRSLIICAGWSIFQVRLSSSRGMLADPPMRLFSVLAPVALAFALAGCDKKAAPAGPPVRSVTAARAEVREVPLYLDEIGSTTAVESVNVQAQVAGQITEIHFQDGADVKKGDLLFSIDPRPYQAALDKATATLAQNSAKLDFQRTQMARMDELRRKNVAASQDYDQARATLSENLDIVPTLLELAGVAYVGCGVPSSAGGLAQGT